MRPLVPYASPTTASDRSAVTDSNVEDVPAVSLGDHQSALAHRTQTEPQPNLAKETAMKGTSLTGVFAALAAAALITPTASAYYDPGQGRFISRDPIEYPESRSVSGYVGGNTMTHVAVKSSGRFIARDPETGNDVSNLLYDDSSSDLRQHIVPNCYWYADGNPTYRVDPTGEAASAPCEVKGLTFIECQLIEFPPDPRGNCPLDFEHVTDTHVDNMGRTTYRQRCIKCTSSPLDPKKLCASKKCGPCVHEDKIKGTVAKTTKCKCLTVQKTACQPLDTEIASSRIDLRIR